MTSELKPCPHCGTAGEFRSDTYGDRKRWWTVCPNKGCEVGYKFFIQEHAAAAWNTRIHSPSVGGSGGGKEDRACGVKGTFHCRKPAIGPACESQCDRCAADGVTACPGIDQCATRRSATAARAARSATSPVA